MTEAYDLVVIGGGSAGLTAAGFAARLGKKVALVEQDRVGGDCTWTGCIPSKTLLKVAGVAHTMRQAGRFGTAPANPAVDLAAVLAHVRTVIAQVYEPESPDAVRAKGIDVYLGEAGFLNPATIAVGENQLAARRFVIATGARPAIPPIPGLDSVDFLTYETVWDLPDAPRSMAIIGGGAIGCELAQAFCRLGVSVTVVEGEARILPQAEAGVSELVQARLVAEGVVFRLGTRVARVSSEDGSVCLETGGAEVGADALLVAVGRRPNLGTLNLENAGVLAKPGGISVDRRLRTGQRHIYAAGDCLGGPQFTHYAGFQGFIAARNALLPGSSRGLADTVPWGLFTDPEVAHAGLTEAMALEQYGSGVMVCRWPLERVDRAVTEGNTDGFIKVVHRPNGKILGVTIAGGAAGEAIHEWILAMNQGISISAVARSMHVYPTYSMGNQQAALSVTLDRMLSGWSGRIIKLLGKALG